MPMTRAILELANDTFVPQDANGYWVYAIGTLETDNGTDTTLADITVHDSVAVTNVDDYGSIYHSSGAAKRDITHEFSVTNFTDTDITLDVLLLYYDDGFGTQLLAYHTITDITVPGEHADDGGTRRYTTTVDAKATVSADEVAP